MSALVVELEFGGVDERPEDVVVAVLVGGIRGNQRQHLLGFGFRGFAAEGADEKLVDDLGGLLTGLEHGGGNLAAGGAAFQRGRSEERRVGEKGGTRGS